MDARLRSAAISAAPRIAAAVLSNDARQLARELRRLEGRCGYLLARRALDSAVRCPESLREALAKSAVGFARAAASGRRAEVTAASVFFVETLVREGAKGPASGRLIRLPISDATQEALLHAAPGAVAALVKSDERLGRNVAAQLGASLVRAQAEQLRGGGGSLKGDLKNAALDAAPSLVSAGIRGGAVEQQKAVLDFVGHAGVVSADHIADRFIRANHEDIFAARRSMGGLVKGLVMHEWLQKREFVVPMARSLPGLVQAAQIPQPHIAFGAGMYAARPVWRQAWTHVIYTTPRAAEQFAVPLPPDLRKAFIPHYLKTMDACLALEKRLDAAGVDVLRITGENQLIRENFRGQVFKKGGVLPKFPDALLTVRGPDRVQRTVNVEYVTKSYTPEMLRSKAAAFVGETVWAVDSRATANKVFNSVGSDADVILV